MRSVLQSDGLQLQVGLSIGLTHDLPPRGSLGGLLRKADGAMYRAKAEGRNRRVAAPGESRPRVEAPLHGIVRLVANVAHR